MAAKNIHNINKNIRLLRTYAGISEDVMAEFFGISTELYRIFENNMVFVKADRIIAFSDLFFLNADELYVNNAPIRIAEDSMRNLSAHDLQDMVKKYRKAGEALAM